MADKYTILSQRETTDMQPGMGWRDVVLVTFQSAGGSIGTVKIPVAKYTAEYVHDQIEPYAEELDKVSQL